jgi:hypothetical protein
MTDADRRAFLRGYSYAAEAMVEAHDGLLAIVVGYEQGLLRVLDQRPELAAVADPRIVAIMAEVRRARFDNEAALALYEAEASIRTETAADR